MTGKTQSQIPILQTRVGDDGSLIDFREPESGNVVAQIRDCGSDTINIVVDNAKRTYLAHRKDARHVRIGWLKAAADVMAAHQDELSQIVSVDVGKPLRAAKFEVGRGVAFLQATAAAAGEIGGETLPLEATAAGAGTIGMTRRVPYGVVAGITPFNAPINLLIQKVAPAIVMGNAIVVKPAISGTRIALRLAELFVEAGWPDGLFEVVSGDREPAHLLAAHRDVEAVTFTGGTQAGHALASSAGAKKFLAELGSNAANVVMTDADLERAAQKLALAGFEAGGQQCISAQRILVQASALQEFMCHFVRVASALKVGSPSDPDADLGPMVHEGAAIRVMEMVDDAVSHGGNCVLKPARRGASVSPCILTNVPRKARIWQEEVFGPVVVVEPFETTDEALEIANDSAFGLQAALFTNDLAVTMRFADDLDVGSLWVNEPSRFRLDIYPFGGVKQSGVGREGVRYALEELSQLKFIGIRPHHKKEN